MVPQQQIPGIYQCEEEGGSNSPRDISKRLEIINRYLGDVKMFYGKYIEQMPRLLSEGRVPMSISQVMQKRLAAEGTSMEEFWLTDNLFDTGDGIAYHPDGRIKIVLDSKHLRKASFVEEAINKIGGSILSEHGTILLSNSDYENLQGDEFSGKDIERFKVMSPKSNPLWQSLARNKLLLNDYVDYIAREYKRRFNSNDIMNIILIEASKKPVMVPIHIHSGNGRKNGSEIDGAFYGLNWHDTRLLGIVSNSKPLNYSAPKIENELEKELLSSRAEGIEKAIKYLAFESDGSLHVNGNYDEERKRELYQEIVARITRDRITNIREKLEENLPSLKLTEQVKPEAIRKYFKEKFGAPIDTYSDIASFYEILLEREIGKNE
jgi:hypothetical protein